MTQPSIDEAARILREFAMNLIRTAKRSGLSRTAVGTLSVLDRLGPQRITRLAELEVVSQPAMTGLIQRLEASGLVVRKSDPLDGRAALIAITTAGHRALLVRRHEYDQSLARRIGTLTPEHHQLLLAALPAISSLAAAEPAQPAEADQSGQSVEQAR